MAVEVKPSTWDAHDSYQRGSNLGYSVLPVSFFIGLPGKSGRWLKSLGIVHAWETQMEFLLKALTNIVLVGDIGGMTQLMEDVTLFQSIFQINQSINYLIIDICFDKYCSHAFTIRTLILLLI